MGYLLDTNILSDMIRHPFGNAANRARRMGDRNVCTSIIVAGELRYGAERRQSMRLHALVAELLDRVDVLPYEVPADAIYARLRHELASTGQPIGNNALLIAAHTLALGHTLVTANLRELSRIDGLACENWLA